MPMEYSSEFGDMPVANI